MTTPTADELRSGDSITWAACAALLCLIFTVDFVTPAGYAEWALYLLPVGLTLRQSIRWVPFVAAAAATVFNAAGLVLSPAGIDLAMAGTNRVIGAIAVWSLAVMVWHVLDGRRRLTRMSWLEQGESLVAQRMLGELAPGDVADQAASALCAATGATSAVMYRLDGPWLLRKGGHAYDADSAPERIAMPQGVAGQVARDGQAIVLEGLADGHLPVVTALGRSAPAVSIVAPMRVDGQPFGIIELGFLTPPRHVDDMLALLNTLAEPVGAALRSALYRRRLEVLLEETQRQGEALQAQQEELRVSNEELAEQSRVLKESQARMELQQTDLQHTNARLEEQANVLERQKLDLMAAQQALQAKAEQLAAASRYKSEFLANMSHELRTPLNSSLILSKLLADNKGATLTREQVKYAKAIHASNNDLLTLINDILDLSKIESGHVDLHVDTVAMQEIVGRLRSTFEPLAQHKRLAFAIELSPDVPETLETDGQRLLQILKNLVANGIKFTEQGDVRLLVRAVAPDRVAFEVRDSGVGIAATQQHVIFEAFRQADGSTSRRFGGTGLGLSISRELARRLGGDIRVDSEPGRGSSFTVELPRKTVPQDVEAASAPPAAAPAPSTPTPPSSTARAGASPAAAALPAAAAKPGQTDLPLDDRDRLARPGRLILAIEDDPAFAGVLHDLSHELDFDCVVAPSGSEGLRLARELQPSGILLDVGLPDQSGLTVLERLKRDPHTRHLPVHMISAHERSQTARELGAIGYVQKPAAREEIVAAIEALQKRLQRDVQRVLVVEDDAALRQNLVLLLSADQVEITAVGAVSEALDQLATRTFDCMVMDLSLGEGSGEDLLEKMAANADHAFPPVIVYTGRALSGDEEQRLRRVSRSIIVKGARSPERLLDEVTLFLHSVESSLPAEQRRLLSQARERDSILDGRRILLAEDDVRNIFALSSVFEPLGARLEIARNGLEALERLQSGPAVDLVLMDVMMPEMDGITAMKRIRERPEWATLPIIALTAKAMPDDRDRCLDAGANDYVAKPIDVDKLVSLCRVWMPK